MSDIISLFFTLIIGLFILVGSVIVLVVKNNDRFIHFSISIAFGVIVSLVILEMLPESIELMTENFSGNKGIVLLLIFTLIGLLISKLLDFFIPDHDIELENHDSVQKNLLHIGLISSIVLIVHNIIEGMAVYSSFINSLSLGILISIGVGLHNIPLGMVITSTLFKANKSLKKTMLIISAIALSTFGGGLIMFLNSNILANTTILGILLSGTLGMLIYIVIFELLPHIMHYKNKVVTLGGIAIGVALMLISVLLG